MKSKLYTGLLLSTLAFSYGCKKSPSQLPKNHIYAPITVHVGSTAYDFKNIEDAQKKFPQMEFNVYIEDNDNVCYHIKQEKEESKGNFITRAINDFKKGYNDRTKELEAEKKNYQQKQTQQVPKTTTSDLEKTITDPVKTVEKKEEPKKDECKNCNLNISY